MHYSGVYLQKLKKTANTRPAMCGGNELRRYMYIQALYCMCACSTYNGKIYWEAVGRRLLAAQNRFYSQDSPCGIFDVNSSTGRDRFYPASRNSTST